MCSLSINFANQTKSGKTGTITNLCTECAGKRNLKMKKKQLAVVLMAAALVLSGCAGKKELQACQESNQKLTTEFQSAKETIAANNERIKSLEEQLAAAKSHADALQSSLDKSLTNAGSSNVNIEKLVDQINESNQYIRHLVEVKSKSDSLNLALTNKLTRSLSNDEMKEVNVQVLKGVVYISLADNMLFESASYKVNDRAKETLSKIAKIINDYKDYEVLVEGNTDNVPVSQSAPSMKNIRNNWDLSALRASSIVQYLQDNFGVDPKRMTAGGRGEYNPIASNDTEVGKQRNRRTQIIITPKLDQFLDLIDKAPDEK